MKRTVAAAAMLPLFVAFAIVGAYATIIISATLALASGTP
jgi:hypothetical protein